MKNECAYCEGVLRPGDDVYDCGDAVIHADCMENMDIKELLEIMGVYLYVIPTKEEYDYDSREKY